MKSEKLVKIKYKQSEALKIVSTCQLLGSNLAKLD